MEIVLKNGESYDLASDVPFREFAACVRATDAFCSRDFDFGDRVTVERVMMGHVISWIFRLDNIEIGRFVLEPIESEFPKFFWQVTLTASSRRQGEKDVERAKLFYQVMDDLKLFYYDYLELCEKPRMRPVHRFWYEHEKQAEAQPAPAETAQVGETAKATPHPLIIVQGDYVTGNKEDHSIHVGNISNSAGVAIGGNASVNNTPPDANGSADTPSPAKI